MAIRRHPLPIVVLCVVSATMLWLYVALTRISEDDVQMPLYIIPPTNQALLSNVPSYINVRIRGTGLQIINVKYIQASSACTLDLTRIRPTKESVFDITRDDIIRSIRTPQAVRTMGVFPGSMTLAVGEQSVKSVPVSLMKSITLREGFMMVGDPVLEPAMVEVRGSNEFLKNLTSWPTVRFAEADAFMNISADVPVSDSLASFVNVVPRTIGMKASIQQIAVVEFRDIPVNIVGNPSGSTFVSPTRIKIAVRGGVDQLSGLTSQDFRAEVEAGKNGQYQEPKIMAPPYVTVVRNTYVRTFERISRELSP